MLRRKVKGERRALEQLREHYEVEKELASRLRNASRQERRHLYSSLYDELFRRVPGHPQLTRKSSDGGRGLSVSREMRFLRRFINRDTTFLEVGPGDCALAFAVAGCVNKVYAVDVSREITRQAAPPVNFELILSDGTDIPLPAGSVHVAYSYQLMEHLHPDDALEQLKNLFAALVPGGVYICVTPNRLSGPWDVSRYFDKVAMGFHLKEYTLAELRSLLRSVGFSRIKACIGARGVHVRFPTGLLIALERVLTALPFEYRSAVVDRSPFPQILGIRVIGVK